MDLLNAEMFGDINTGSCQNMEDCQTLFRMNTNDLLPPLQGGNMDEMFLSDFFRGNGIVDMQCVKYEAETPKALSAMYGDEPPNHYKKTPILDEFIHPLQSFTVAISGKPCSASSWCYSTELEKLFVKKKTPVTFDVSFSQPTEGTLKLRVMLVYSNSQYAYNTITRCQDDISKDGAKDYQFKEHVVRCLNPEASYTGREDGVNFEDRLAVIVDLNNGAVNQQKLQTVPVSLEFLCQNSCPTMERRATTLLFTAENEHGTLLGRKSICVKICSCPKRDMDKDEKKVTGRESNKNKRKQANETVVSSTDQPPRKISRHSSTDVKPTANSTISTTSRTSSTSVAMPTSSMQGQIKREPSFTTLGRSLSTLSNSSTVDNDSSAVVLTLRLPDLACAADVAMYAFKHLSSILVSCKDEQEKTRYAQYLSHCRRVRKNFERSAEMQDQPSLDYDSS
ncbi:cellular tumor antigen p53-like [Anopheles marshallii]|uniref:cellular tumor antigen p53-like n=1 Tax=Anopheles marshallii TaxID=1521116 RepID=UPI00237B3EF1|nr:cellular tumor antigen p53-like [Anopheles marshallii]